MSKRKHVGLREEDLSTTMGFLEDNNVEFTECRYEIFDYAGKKPPAPAFYSKVIDLDDEPEHEQRWSIGGTPDDWEIGEDGDILIPLSKKAMKGVNAGSNFGQLITSLINNAFSNDILGEGRASGFDGLKAHVIRVESKGKFGDEEGGKKRETVIVDKILEGETTKKDKKGDKKTTKEGSSTSEGSGSDLETTTIKFVLDLINENDGEVPKKKIAQVLYADTERDKKEINGMVEFLFSDEWMKDANRPWTLKNGMLTV